MDLKIRDAVETDLMQLLAIYNDAVITTTAVYDYLPRTSDAQIEWFRSKQEAGYPVLVAESNGSAVGYCSYGPFRAWPAYSKTIEWSVYIDPKFSGKGVASALMPHLIARARSQQFHTILAGIDTSNQASLKLHQKLGFLQVAHFKQVGWKFDRWLDLVFMQLILT